MEAHQRPGGAANPVTYGRATILRRRLPAAIDSTRQRRIAQARYASAEYISALAGLTSRGEVMSDHYMGCPGYD